MSLATATVAISNNTSLGVRSVTIPDNKSWLITGYTTSTTFTLSYPSSTGPYSTSPAGLLSTSPGGYVMLPSGTEIRAASNSVAIFSIVEIDSVEADVPVPAPTPTPVPDPSRVLITNITTPVVNYGDSNIEFSFTYRCLDGVGDSIYIFPHTLWRNSVSTSTRTVTFHHNGSTYTSSTSGSTGQDYLDVTAYRFNVPTELRNSTDEIEVSILISSITGSGSGGPCSRYTAFIDISGDIPFAVLDSNSEFNRDVMTLSSNNYTVDIPELTLEWDGQYTVFNFDSAFVSTSGIDWISFAPCDNPTGFNADDWAYEFMHDNAASGNIMTSIMPNLERGIPPAQDFTFTMWVRFSGLQYPVSFSRMVNVVNNS